MMLDFYFNLELYFALFRLISEYSYIPDACVTKQLLIFNDFESMNMWTPEQPIRRLIFLWTAYQNAHISVSWWWAYLEIR